MEVFTSLNSLQAQPVVQAANEKPRVPRDHASTAIYRLDSLLTLLLPDFVECSSRKSFLVIVLTFFTGRELSRLAA